MDFYDDEAADKHPFEFEAEENNNKQREDKKKEGKKPMKQATLGFKKKESSSESSSDDDDDDDDLKAFDFGAHKAKPTQRPSVAMSSLLADDKGKKRKSDTSQDILLPTKYPKGHKKLPEGWTAREYKSVAKKGEKYWLYSHALYGDCKDKKLVLERSPAEWEELVAKRHAKRPSASAGGGGASQGGGEDAGSSLPAEDPLAALLGKKQRREEEAEATRAAVASEMTERMDVGVRANQQLLASQGIK